MDSIEDGAPLAALPRSAMSWFNLFYIPTMFALGVPGNLLTVVIIATKKELRTSFNLLVAVLAAADWLTMAVTVPLHFKAVATRLPASMELCRTELFFGVISFTVSLILIPSIAVIRLYAAKSGVFFKLPWSIAVTITAVASLASLGSSVLLVLYSPTVTRLTCFTNNRITNVTTEINQDNKRKVNIIFSLIIVALTLTTIIYIAMARHLMKKRRTIVHPIITPTLVPSKNILTFSAVSAILTLLFLSYACSMTVAMVYVSALKDRLGMDAVERTSLDSNMTFIVKSLIYSQSAFNWIIYTFASKRYRNVLRGLICRKRHENSAAGSLAGPGKSGSTRTQQSSRDNDLRKTNKRKGIVGTTWA